MIAWVLAQTDSAPVITAIITGIVAVIIALIGVWTTKLTRAAGMREQAQNIRHSEDALEASNIAVEYAAALDSKKALIEAQQSQIDYLAAAEISCQKRLTALEDRYDEAISSLQSASLLQREQASEISVLQEKVEKLNLKVERMQSDGSK